ncbi:hypothetical protein BHE74_00015171 [Ensete ventricosum]|nr:hypothetical protein GW17_00011413 [Ensete ventricosum]RWW76721.1 hypothetical protein BHE74_00015171 [Ensete ventricosum]
MPNVTSPPSNRHWRTSNQSRTLGSGSRPNKESQITTCALVTHASLYERRKEKNEKKKKNRRRNGKLAAVNSSKSKLTAAFNVLVTAHHPRRINLAPSLF